MSRRGRPKKANISIDFGTPELLEKKNHLLTLEAIDLCLYRGIISPEEHKYGLKLRWLYTLKFGSPYIKSAEFLETSGRHISKHRDDGWLREKQVWYDESIKALDSAGLRKLVVDVCIFNAYPNFLERPNSSHANFELENFQEGLKIISQLLKSYQVVLH